MKVESSNQGQIINQHYQSAKYIHTYHKLGIELEDTRSTNGNVELRAPSDGDDSHDKCYKHCKTNRFGHGDVRCKASIRWVRCECVGESRRKSAKLASPRPAEGQLKNAEDEGDGRRSTKRHPSAFYSGGWQWPSTMEVAENKRRCRFGRLPLRHLRGAPQ